MIFKPLIRSSIHVGTPLLMDIFDINGRLLLNEKAVIHTELQLSKLLDHGAYIDANIADDIGAAILLSHLGKTVKAVGLLQEWEKIVWLLKSLLTHPERNRAFLAQLAIVAERIVILHEKNEDFSIYRVVRHENYFATSYSYTHAVHTAVVCILLSRHLDWPAERTLSLVQASLTMNMTIIELQGTIAGQKEPVDKRQRAEISGHPEKAVNLLKALGVTDSDWLLAVEQHHENSDGTGYPTDCKEVSGIANLLRIADMFTAKISPNSSRAVLSPRESISRIFLEDKGGAMSMALIKTMGIYPPGDYVRMASGELGVVVERTAHVKAPIVAAITDTAGRAISSLSRRDTLQAKFAITSNVSDKSVLQRLPPERLFGFSIVNHLDLPPIEIQM